jgi:hypothetical protein
MAVDMDVVRGVVELTREADPRGLRTLGVLTKPDLVEEGIEVDII